MTKVAQIIPYFGKWPEWMPLYLYSCSRNRMIDFFFYTDCDTETLPMYENIIFKRMSFAEYCGLVSKRLGIHYNIAKAYKLTDLKPFIGVIHQEELENYEFWSFGDLDLCYGDLSMVAGNENLSRYDLITTHCYHIAGHLTIIRNNDYYRNLCFRIENWREKIVSDTHYALDEGEWSRLVYPTLSAGRFLWKHLFSKLRLTDFFSYLNKFNSIFNKKQLFREYYTSPAPKPGEKWAYDLKSGNVVDSMNRKLPYIHFLFFKKTPWLESEYFWRENFYQLDNEIDHYSAIEVSLEGIRASV